MPRRLSFAELHRLALAVLLLAASAAARAQNFAQPTVIPTGAWPAAVYTADINADGFPDLVYIDQGAQPGLPSTTHVLLNDGKGDFKQSASLATGGNSVALGDLTGSGQVDIAWFSLETTPNGQLQTLYIAAGRGDGTFSPAAEWSSFVFAAAPGYPSQLFQNLVATNLKGALGPHNLLAQVPNGIYSEFWTFVIDPASPSPVKYTEQPLPGGIGPVQIVDLNNDGKPDVIVNGLATGAAQVFLNTGSLVYGLNGSGPNSTTTGAGSIHSLQIQDVNGDGRPDLIAEGPNGRLDIFFGNGDGTFQPTSSGGTGTLNGLTGNGGHLITLADLNHDGQFDALTSTPAGVSTLLGQGTAYLGLKGIFNAGPGMHAFATADFNGDGNLDLATDSPEGIAILYGNPDGTFQTSQAFAAGQPALSGAVGQLTITSTVDAVVSTGSTQAQVLIGSPNGTFAAVGGATTPIPTNPDNGLPGLWSGIQTGDFNSDGLPDLAITADGPSSLLPTTGSGLTLLFGKGDGTFQSPVHPIGPLTPQQQPTSAAPFYGISSKVTLGAPPTGFDALFTCDAQVYRAYADQPSPSGNVVANGYFGTQTTTTARAHNFIAAGGLQQYGTPTGLPGIIAQQDGDLILYPDPTNQYGTGQGDLHIDGSLTSPGQLTAPDISTTFPGLSSALGFRAFPGSAAIGDLDGSNNGDLLVVYANLDANLTAPAISAPNYLYIWYGSGGGKFLTSAAHPVNPVRVQLSRNYYQVALADLNNDGIADLILSDGYIVDVQYGKGDGTFGAEHHFLAGQGINTISAADVNGDGALDLVIANGGAVLSNPVANLEVLATNPDVNTGGITVLLNATPEAAATVSGTLIAMPNPAAFEAAYTLITTITTPAGSPVPTGTVAFSIAGNSVGSAPVTNGAATLAIPASGVSGTSSAKPLPPGAYTLTASYGGDTNYAAYTGLIGSLTVNRAPTSVTLTPTTPLQTTFGGPANGTFAVQVLDGSYPATGTYTVYDNGVAVPICTNLPLTANGVPVDCPYGDPILLNAGSHAFTVGYNGDPINAPSISLPVTYVISPDPTLVTSLTTSLTPAPVGQPVTFSATVTGTLAVPTGTVIFYESATIHALVVPLGSGTLNAAGVATFTTSTLPVDTYLITAHYAGNQNFNTSGAGPITQAIVALPVQVTSSVMLASNRNPSAAGQGVTLTAALAFSAPFVPDPTGTVSFLDGTAVLATVPLGAANLAVFTTSSLAAGSHNLTAAYSGGSGISPMTPPGPPQPPGSPYRAPLRSRPAASKDTSIMILPAVSPVLVQAVDNLLPQEPAGFTLNVSPVPINLGIGRTAVLLVQVTPVSGFAQPVSLSCGPLPTEVTCTFALTTFPSGGGATTLNLATAAPHDCGNPGSPYGLGALESPRPALTAFAMMFLPGLAVLSVVRRHRWQALLRDLAVLALACAGLASMCGCGHCTDLGTRPGSYSFTVTATPQGSPVTQSQSQSIQLNMHD